MGPMGRGRYPSTEMRGTSLRFDPHPYTQNGPRTPNGRRAHIIKKNHSLKMILKVSVLGLRLRAQINETRVWKIGRKHDSVNPGALCCLYLT